MSMQNHYSKVNSNGSRSPMFIRYTNTYDMSYSNATVPDEALLAASIFAVAPSLEN